VFDSGVDFDANRNDVYVCYLEDANDTDWEILEGAICVPGANDSYMCTLEISSFGIYAPCMIMRDCNGIEGGVAYHDTCGDCVGGDTGHEENAAMDNCGLCDGPGVIDWYLDIDGDGQGSGEPFGFCSDIVPYGYVTNNIDAYPECSANYYDECEVCGGDGPEIFYNCDNLHYTRDKHQCYW
jgi:hypothetical protein